jgi:hypothetical protein
MMNPDTIPVPEAEAIQLPSTICMMKFIMEYNFDYSSVQSTVKHVSNCSFVVYTDYMLTPIGTKQNTRRRSKRLVFECIVLIGRVIGYVCMRL